MGYQSLIKSNTLEGEEPSSLFSSSMAMEEKVSTSSMSLEWMSQVEMESSAKEQFSETRRGIWGLRMKRGNLWIFFDRAFTVSGKRGTRWVVRIISWNMWNSTVFLPCQKKDYKLLSRLRSYSFTILRNSSDFNFGVWFFKFRQLLIK